eukprot:scaffold4658_cov118-Cylindrotheca_fusiformis.AAC.2
MMLRSCFSNRIQSQGQRVQRLLLSSSDYFSAGNVVGSTRQNTPRMFSGSSSSPSNSKRGGLFIGLGWTLLGLVALDQVLQYRQEQEAKERLEILSRMQQEADEMNQVEWDTTTLQSIFECKIRHVEPSLDGTKILSNIRVGDVVEVLESDVGPNKAYHLCRRPAIGKRKESIGWYPHQFMDVVDD